MNFILGIPQAENEYYETVFLNHNKGWNDWFKYITEYFVTLYDNNGTKFDLGIVKIGQQEELLLNGTTPNLPNSFEELDKSFFSLGQDQNYYEVLYTLNIDIRNKFLAAIKDCAYNIEHFNNNLEQPIMKDSLLRYIDKETVYSKFHNLIVGVDNLSSYSFNYQFPHESDDGFQTLDFSVFPESKPPSNIHIIIGRNGVGKTRLLRNMTLSLKNDKVSEYGSLIINEEGRNTSFSNLISVSFSAFDPFEPLPDGKLAGLNIIFNYVGLQRAKDKDGNAQPTKTPEDLKIEFETSLKKCLIQPRLNRWKESIDNLNNDPLFKDAEISSFIDQILIDRDIVLSKFNRLSSGHKIVLLTITRLVELVNEKTLVMLDEPESHLHPPLFSSFVRALSFLLTKRNGVAIIATHSPVVLQEVPKECVWIIDRSGEDIRANRPINETFGENVGILTQEVFKLEVTSSGFHKLLKETISTSNSYEEVLKKFDGKLGNEAKAIVQSLMYYKLMDKNVKS